MVNNPDGVSCVKASCWCVVCVWCALVPALSRLPSRSVADSRCSRLTRPSPLARRAVLLAALGWRYREDVENRTLRFKRSKRSDIVRLRDLINTTLRSYRLPVPHRHRRTTGPRTYLVRFEIWFVNKIALFVLRDTTRFFHCLYIVEIVHSTVSVNRGRARFL